MAKDPATHAFRFGFGLPMPEGAPTDTGRVLAALAAPDAIVIRHPGLGFEAAHPLLREIDITRRARRKDPAQEQPYRAAILKAETAGRHAARAGFARALDNPDGFRERLVRFWADHFTTAAKNRQELVLPGTLVEDAIRPNLAGRFTNLLSAVTLHPAMLIYLDQTLSIGPKSKAAHKRGVGLNENLARELIELHTLGVGAGYSQNDVRQMAELLTGLTVDPERGFAFEPRRAEPGAEVVLGISYDGEGTAPILAALEDLAMRPETAGHIARKLAVHFVSDTPDADLVAHMRRAYLDTGGDLTAVYRALLDHPAASTAQATKVRQPFEFIVASLRALGVDGDALIAAGDTVFRRLVASRVQAMGQPLLGPGGPDGWPEEAAAWINPQGLAARINWAMEVPSRLLRTLPDPTDLANRALGPRAGKLLILAVQRAETVREAVGLVLASAEFNRR